MSQAGVASLKNALPPAGPVDTLTGNTGGAVAPTGGNINIVGDVSSFINVVGTPGTSTLTIELLNQQVATVTTFDATPTVVTGVTFPVVPSRAVSLEYSVIAAISDYSEMFQGVLQQSALRGAAGAPVLQVDLINTFTNGFANTPSAAISVVGNSIVFTVTGLAATTINWKVVLTFLSI